MIFKNPFIDTRQNSLKEKNGGPNQCSCLRGMGAPLITHSSQTKNDRLFCLIVQKITKGAFPLRLNFMKLT